MNWWEGYFGTKGGEDVLSEFKSVGEFQEYLPHNIVLSIGKLTLRESVEIVRYFRTIGSWPSIGAVHRARGGLKNQLKHYTYKDLFVDDKYEEHF